MAPTPVFSLPVSTSLLREVNAVGAPTRIKAQDGTIGDTAHEGRVSDHNRDEIGNTGSSHDSDNIPEVHARDVDARGPWLIRGGAERIVQLIVTNVRARGRARRRVKYVIYKRRIWQWAGGQFVQRAYSGADPHTEHFHVSFEYGSGNGAGNPENDTSPWGVLAAYEQERDDMPSIDEVRAVVADELAKRLDRVQKYDAANKPVTGPSPYMGSAYALGVISRDAGIAARGVATVVKAIAALDTVDEAALARELAPLVAAGVLAGLPEGVTVTEELVETAVKNALRAGTDS